MRLLVLMFSGALAQSLDNGEQQTQPNILYILADDLGYNDVSWNNPSMLTPHLHSLAKEGLIIDKYYTPAKCSPSRAALLTGLYPHRIGIQRGSIGPFRPTGLATVFPTLPELLREVGYSTHLVGKWHLGYCHPDYLPTRRGFDTFFGHYGQQADHYTRVYEKNSHIGAGYDLRRNENLTTEGQGVYSTQLWEWEAIDLIDKSVLGNRPWYIQLSLTAPLLPYQAPQKYIDMIQKGNRHRNYKKTEYELEVVRRAMITAIDESVGNIVDKLKETGVYNRTLIIFTSDNGSGHHKANLPFRGQRGTMYEGAIRVPAFVHSPLINTRTKLVRDTKHLVHTTDWFPTLLKLAGRQAIPDNDGYDIWSLLTGADDSGRRRDTIYHNLDTDDKSGTYQEAVRRHDWKLIRGRAGKFNPESRRGGAVTQLYNLADDPRERNDLSSVRPDLVAELGSLLVKEAGRAVQSFQPSRDSLGYPRYHDGVLETGWCRSRML